MEHFEKLLKEMAFSKSEITDLLDVEKSEQHQEILKAWSARYNDHILDKPEVKDKFKKEYELSAGKEATRKSRKSISNDLSLGLTNKQIEELTNEEFSAIVKEHANKEGDTKFKDLEAQYKEEKRLREEAETKLESEIEKVKTEFFQKDIDREIQLRKANKLASKDSTKFDKSDMELIEYAIEGAKINQGISFVTENGKVYVTKEGQKQRNQSNELIQYEDWLEPILSKFEIKQRKTPDAKLDEKGNPIEIKEDSEAVKRLKATYEAKGITVGATA